MIKVLVACVALVVMTLMPAVALADHRGGFGVGFNSGPFYGGWGNGNLVGLGQPAFSGYYFRPWNGAYSVPYVDYGPALYASPVLYAPGGVYVQPSDVYVQPLAIYAAPVSVPEYYSTPAYRPANSSCRYFYGGAVRFNR